MRNNRPFRPEAKLYSTEQIIVVGRVVFATNDNSKVFEVDRLVEIDQKLVVRDQFKNPRAPTRRQPASRTTSH